MLSKISFSALLIISLIASFSSANPNKARYELLRRETVNFTDSCIEQSCDASYVQELLYRHDSELNKLSPGIQRRLESIARHQAQLWGDTILEGDYFAKNDTRLDAVIALYKNNEFIGYKIEYSETAWWVGDCDFEDSEASLEGCEKGRIVERSYVTANAANFFNDQEHYAEFMTVQQ